MNWVFSRSFIFFLLRMSLMKSAQFSPSAVTTSARLVSSPFCALHMPWTHQFQPPSVKGVVITFLRLCAADDSWWTSSRSVIRKQWWSIKVFKSASTKVCLVVKGLDRTVNTLPDGAQCSWNYRWLTLGVILKNPYFRQFSLYWSEISEKYSLYNVNQMSHWYMVSGRPQFAIKYY